MFFLSAMYSLRLLLIFILHLSVSMALFYMFFFQMLFEMNHSLDSDRRALMDHVSQLLSQYHSLLTHSLEDKQNYHLEEKLYTDKVNNLCRQKEKLEEKIMEHYRKLDNASAKKKSFGATLVRKVRKAGSDIINKVPSRVSLYFSLLKCFTKSLSINIKTSYLELVILEC